jgi:lysophospholipase L1-like esterase
MRLFPVRAAVLAIPALLVGLALSLTASGQATAPAASTKPTVWLIGDSTVNNTANGGLGWGAPIAKLFDPEKAAVMNRARGGRSARSFDSEGLWNAVRDQLKPGDFVLIQFGHNDGPGNEQQIANSTNGRPDLKGTGDETTTGPDSSPQHKMETVHTYGWYLKKFVRESKEKGARPIMLSMVPKNYWADGKIRRPETNSLVAWAKEVATAENIPFIDLNSISAKRLEAESPETVKTKYFTPPGDTTHTNPEGAKLNAESVVMGLRALKGLPINEWLSDAGKALAPADASEVALPATGAAAPSIPAAGGAVR